MTLSDVYTALARHVTGGRIDLFEAGSDPDLPGMSDALALLRITSAFAVEVRQLIQPAGQVVLSGGARWGLPPAPDAPISNVATVTASVVATMSDQQRPVFQVRLDLPPDWTFSTTFKTLAPSEMLNDHQTVSFQTSFLAGLPVANARLSASSLLGTVDDPATVRLTGDLPAEGVFRSNGYDAFFPGRWPLALSGPITLPANLNEAPAMSLYAVVPDSQLPFGDTHLERLGFELLSATGLDASGQGESAISTLGLVGTVAFNATTRLTLFLALLATQDTWRLLVVADPDSIRIGDQLGRVAALLGLGAEDLMSPESLQTFNEFYLAELEVWLPKYAGSLTETLGSASFDIANIAVTVQSDKEWDPPIPFVTITDVGTRWVIGRTTDGTSTSGFLAGSVFGGFKVGRKPTLELRSGELVPDAAVVAAEPDSFTVDIAAMIPSFVIEGSLRTDDAIPIGYALNQFFGSPGPPTESDMKITAFTFTADPRALTFDAAAVVTTDWSIPFTDTISLDVVGLELEIHVQQSKVGGRLAGTLRLTGAGDTPPRFTVSAEYPVTGRAPGWTFRGQLDTSTPLSLSDLVANFLSTTVPSGLPRLTVDVMSLEFNSESKHLAGEGGISMRWKPTILGDGPDDGLTISASASATIERADADTDPTGTLTGSFTINRIGASLSREIGVEDPAYTFKILFGDAELVAETGWDGKDEKRHRIISLHLADVTLGEILEWLVDLVAPTLGYSLEPPWDVINRIDLSRFTLVVDPTEQKLSLTYDVDLDLAIIQIKKVGISYQRKQGDGVIDLIVEGKALGEDFTGPNALSWDVVNDPPPSLVPSDTGVVDLRYLAFGQHVSISGSSEINTVRGFLDRMETAMREVDDDASPLGQRGASGVEFAADSEWLIGLDIGLAGLVDIGIVFNDPRIYGLSVSVSGESAGALEGLDFEILYKKITDTIGMFRVELTVPDAFRHLELGEVSVTLGVIVVEIYTNGNFKLDLGFPYERNFERSFSVEVFPFLGRGGIYFGLLDGNTSRRVPIISNGSFAPVIELGVGLAVGVGKDFTVGPLSAGAYVELEVIFEGVFALFNPQDSTQDQAVYYWMQGVAALHGKVYGKVDLAVITVNVTLEASATVALMLEAHQPTLVDLNLDVRAKASVKVFFVTVHLSFHVSYDLAFTIGKATPTPWIVESPPSSKQAALTALHPRSLHPSYRPHPHLKRAHLLQRHYRALAELGILPVPGLIAADLQIAAPETTTLNWAKDHKVFSDSPRALPLVLLPSFTYDSIPLGWTTPPGHNATDYRVSLQLFADSGADAHTESIEGTYRRTAVGSAHAETVSELPAALLVDTFLRWAVYAVTNPAGGTAATQVTSAQLALLEAEMSAGDATRTAFEFANLATFLDTNLRLQISGQPAGATDTTGFAGMPVALPPALNLAWSGEVSGSCDLGGFNSVGASYVAGISNYQNSFTPQAPGPAEVPDDGGHGYTSFAGHLFDDWCLMLTKTAVEEARKCLAAWPVKPTQATTLAAVAATFEQIDIHYQVRSGATLASVAEALGATVDELHLLNPNLEDELAHATPGVLLTVHLGVVPELVALDNAGQRLVSGRFPLGDVGYQLREGDTLSSVAERFGLASASALLAGTELADDRALLRPGAAFQSPATQYSPPPGFGALQCAALYYSRFSDRSTVPNRQQYADLIAFWNADALKGQELGQPVPPGTQLSVPESRGQVTKPVAPNYQSLVGDTVSSIAAMLDLTQNLAVGDAPGVPGWSAYRDAMIAAFNAPSSGVSPPVLIPTTITVEPGESLARLARRSYLYGGSAGAPDVQGLLGWLQAQPDLLRPLASVTIPGFVLDTAACPTLAAASAALGIGVAVLGSRLATQAIVPAFVEGEEPWVVQHVPVSGVDTLVALVLEGDAVTTITGRSARQLLSGTRLPAPVDVGGTAYATGPMTAMNALSGQQLVGPAPGPGSTEALSITVRTDPGIDWIQFTGTTTVAAEETFESLLGRAPEALAYNRALLAEHGADPEGRSSLPEGALVQTGVATELAFTYTQTELQTLYPAPSLTVSPVRPPAALVLGERVPVLHGLDQRIELQVGTGVAIPQDAGAPKAGNPSLWPFPSSLVARARQRSSTPYELVRSRPRGERAGREESLLDTTYGTLIPLKIKVIADRSHLYQLLGSDDVDRQTLLSLWQYLTPSPPLAPQVGLFTQPDPTSPNAQGLAQFALDGDASYLLRTNLSTQTVPGLPDVGPLAVRAMAATSEDPVCGAAVTDAREFLTLLWEGTSVGGAGYYLSLTDADGHGLDASLFDQTGEAIVRLLVIVGAQQAVAPSGRPLLACNNCALVGAGLDASVHSLFVEAADDSETTLVPTVPQGNVGVTMTLPIPPADPVTPDDRTRSLFSVANYTLGGGSAVFVAPWPGVPMLPEAIEGVTKVGARAQSKSARQSRARGEDLTEAEPKNWYFTQVFPIARYGPPSKAPTVAGLPDPADDPYRGISQSAALPSAEVSIGFNDVYGNATAPGPPGPGVGTTVIGVGYTDVLVAFESWPALTRRYDLAPGSVPGAVRLSIALGTRAATALPSLSEPPAQASDRAGKQAAAYTGICYQLAQPGLSLSALTTLHTDGQGDPTPIALDGAVAGLFRFAAANRLYCAAAVALVPETPLDAAGQSVATLTATYGLTAEQFGSALGGLLARDVLGAAPVPVSAYVSSGPNTSAATIVAGLKPGWPIPTAEALLGDPSNATLPLAPGVALAIPATPLRTPIPPIEPTLAEFAQAHGTTAPYLAEDNARNAALLAGAQLIVIDAQTVITSPLASDAKPRTFRDVADAFTALGVIVTVADVAAAVADQPGLVAADAPVTSTRYVVPAPTVARPFETLAANGSGAAVAQLAQDNQGTVGLFDAGTLVHVGPFAPQPAVSADSTLTLTQFCELYATTPARLFADLAAQPGYLLPASDSVFVPGMVTMPADASELRVPYAVQATDTLSKIAGRFAYAANATAVATLGSDNQEMPGLLLAGQTVSVQQGGATFRTTTQGGDTVAAVWARLEQQSSAISLDDVIAAIAAQEGLLAEGALLSCPPARLPQPGSGAGAGLTAADITGSYTLDASLFAQANLATKGLLVAGLPLVSGSDGGAVTVVIAPEDTFNALLARFAAAGAPSGFDAADLLGANPGAALFRVGALALLPPAPLAITTEIDADPGKLAQPVTPLRVSLTLSRPAALIDPTFDPQSPACPQRAFTTPIGAPVAGGAAGDAGAFGTRFAALFPRLRLASGRVVGSADELWFVDFGASGVSSLEITGPVVQAGGGSLPRYLSLRPLYTDLVSLIGVRLPVVSDAGVVSDGPTPSDLVSIDAETWAQRLLEDVDRFLSPACASALYADPATRPHLQTVLAAKATLTAAIPPALAPVLDHTDPGLAGAVASAGREISQLLGQSLVDGYQVSTVIQYQTACQSAWSADGTTLRPARLVGAVAGEADQSGRAYSVTSAKTDLAATQGHVNFLLTMNDPATSKTFALDPGYVFSHIEIGITDIDVGTGTPYQASDWLTFAPALDTAMMPTTVKRDMPSIAAPLPNRAFPQVPTLRTQSAGIGAAAELADLGRWEYALRYLHEHAVQDEVVVTAHFNRPAGAGLIGQARLVTDDLATRLARYNAVADRLWDFLGFFADPGSGGAGPAAAAAAGFATLVSEAASAWDAHWRPKPLPDDRTGAADPLTGLPLESFGYGSALEVDGAAGEASYDITAVTLTLQQAAAGPGGAWPTVTLNLPDGKTLATTSTPLGPTQTRYALSKPTRRLGFTDLTLTWPSVPIDGYQNAQAAITAQRNGVLSDTAVTNSDFVLTSDIVTAPNAVVPMGISTERRDITGLGPSMGAALTAAFTEIFGAGYVGQPVTIDMFFGFELVGGGAGGLISYLPVALYPHQTLAAGTGATLEAAAQQWLTRTNPTRQGGEIVFSVRLYSQIASTSTQTLLVIENLYYRL